MPKTPLAKTGTAARDQAGDAVGAVPAKDAAAGAPRNRRTQAERRETARKRILASAARVVRMRGYDGLSTEEVSQLAGVSRGALRHHFPTKNNLMVSTLHFLNEEMLGKSWSRVERAKSGGDVLELVIEDAFDFFFGDYFFINLAISMSDERNSDLHMGARAIRRDSRLAIEKTWIERMKVTGLPARVASDVVALTFSIVRGFAIRRMIVDDSAEFERLIATWRKMVRSHMLTYRKRASEAAEAGNGELDFGRLDRSGR
jgi:AcrR family transcriptional regulator